MTANAERNLLFGILALQRDFISQEAWLRAMNAWTLDTATPLGQILLHQHALSGERLVLLEALVEEHLAQHGNDPRASLVAVTWDGPLQCALDQLVDPVLLTTLAQVGAARQARDAALSSQGAGASVSAPSGLRFRVLRPHAKGGLGQVSVAHDEELQREVAFKEIQDRHADDPDTRARFVLEAEITGRLEHPGIVPVYGLGRHADGPPFYAMRFIRGDSLKEAIEQFHKADEAGRDPGQRTLELRQLLRRFVDVCNAVGYAHSRGVLHRDLKPGNVMLGNFGETLVVDWGLAKALDRPELATAPEGPLRPTASNGSAPTQLGAVIGTPAFMSPEQAEGRLDALGPASDVYSLGATLYCLLTGRVPFNDTDLGTLLENVRRGKFPPPRQVKPAVPPGLEAICLRALALRPEARYPSTRLLADDLEHWLADEPVTALRESRVARLRRWARRHRPVVTAAGAALAVALVALALTTLFLSAANERERTARESAEANEREAKDQRDEARKQRNAAGRQAAELLLDHGLQLCEQHDVRQGLLWLALSLQQAAGYEAPELETAVRLNLDAWQRHAPPLHGMFPHPGAVRCTAVDAKGGLFASGSDDGMVRLWEAATGERRPTAFRHRSAVLAVVFSPDCQALLAGTDDGTAQVWDVRTGKERGQPLRHQQSVGAVAFSPDGRTVATASADKTARLWEAATGKPLSEPLPHEEEVWALAFSPDGRLILTGADTLAQLWDTDTGKPVGEPLRQRGVIRSVAFSRDGRLVLTGSRDRTARVWDVATRKPVGPALAHQAWVQCLACSPDGHFLLTGDGSQSPDHGAGQLWEMPQRAGGGVDRIVLEVEVLTGLKLDERRVVQTLDAAAWQDRRRRLAALDEP